MLDLLSSIGEFIGSLGMFLALIIGSLFEFIANIPTYFNFVSVLLTSLPEFLLPYTVAGVSLTIVAMLISRKII